MPAKRTQLGELSCASAEPAQVDCLPAASYTFPAGLIKRVHVNMHVIRKNIKTGATEPVITVQFRGKPYRFASVEILGTSRVIYAPTAPLGCGARVWIETTAATVGFSS